MTIPLSLSTLNKEVKRLKSTYGGIDKLLGGAVNPIVQELKEIYRNDMSRFCVDFWPYAGTSTKLIKGYAWDARIIHTKALFERQIKYLLWTEPPKEGKSTFFNVLAPAYRWICDPKERFLTTCYAERWAVRDNRYMQQLICSEAYQQLFGMDFYLTTRSRDETRNSAGGERLATHIDGQNTSAGATILMFDDPNSVADAESPGKLEKVCNLFDSTFIHRQIDPGRTGFFVGQHRISPFDLYGHVLSKNYDSCVAVELPFEFESHRKCVTYLPGCDDVLWEDHRTEDGELLNPKRHSPEYVKDIKLTMTPLKYSSLFQCQPLPSKGGVFEKSWFKVWNSPHLPPFEFVIVAWDTALTTKTTSSYSAATVFGVFEGANKVKNIMFLSSWLGKEEWTELRKMVIRLSRNVFDTDKSNPIGSGLAPDLVLIEGKANGISMAQSIRDIGINAVEYNPPRMGSRMYGKTGDGKILRARVISPYVESGRVYIMGKYPYDGRPCEDGKKFIDTCVNFPHLIDGGRDIMDTFSMAIDFLRSRKYLMTHEEIQLHRSGRVHEDISEIFEGSDASVEMFRNFNFR